MDSTAKELGSWLGSWWALELVWWLAGTMALALARGWVFESAGWKAES